MIERGQRWLWPVIGLLCLVLLVPILVCEVPPLLDYPNHLARMYVLAHPDDPYLSRIYAAHWTIIPNIAIDALIPLMLKIMPLNVAGRIVLAMAILFSVAGTFLYARAAFGRIGWWQLGVGLIAYHALILMGFLNFDLGLGLALLCGAGWTAWRESWPKLTIAASILLALLLFFIHLFSLGFFLLLIFCHEAVYIHAHGKLLATNEKSRLARGRIVPLALIAAIPAVLYLSAPISGVASGMSWFTADMLPITLLCAFLTYSLKSAIIVGVLCVVFAGYCWRRKYVHVHPPALLAAAILLAIFLACPGTAMGTAFLNVRFSVMLAFMLFAGLQPQNMPRLYRTVALIFLACAIGVRMGVLTADWVASNQDIAEIRKVTATVKPGSKVLVVMSTVGNSRAYWAAMPQARLIDGFFPTFIHLPALLVSEHQSFWPLMFSSPSKQPIEVLPPYRRLALYEGMPLSYKLLGLDTLPDEVIEDAPYFAHWQSDFDYVLVLLAGAVPDPWHLFPDRLQAVDVTDMAALYKIKPPTDARQVP